MRKRELVPNTYVRVCGTVRQFNGRTSITVYHIRPIQDFNEVCVCVMEDWQGHTRTHTHTHTHTHAHARTDLYGQTRMCTHNQPGYTTNLGTESGARRANYSFCAQIHLRSAFLIT
jgi:hypothetical protein